MTEPTTPADDLWAQLARDMEQGLSDPFSLVRIHRPRIEAEVRAAAEAQLRDAQHRVELLTHDVANERRILGEQIEARAAAKAQVAALVKAIEYEHYVGNLPKRRLDVVLAATKDTDRCAECENPIGAAERFRTATGVLCEGCAITHGEGWDAHGWNPAMFDAATKDTE